MAAEKQNNEQTGLFHRSCNCPRVVILLSFRSHIHPSSGTVICPWHACPAQRGSPGRTNPHRRLCSAPTTLCPPPRPHSFPVALCLPPAAAPRPSLQSPASLPYDLDADKTRGPTVPSAWCQHFPLIQSLSQMG